MATDEHASDKTVDRETGTTAPDDWAPRERISWFPIPDEADLDPRVADLVARQRAKLGALNNVVRPRLAPRADAALARLL